MTREDLKKHWEVIEAFKNGAVVEYRPFLHDKWYETQEITLNIGCEYRIAKRDWAWACEMMLAGKKVTDGREAVGVLGMNSSGVVMYYPSTTQPHSATIERLHLLATDWRLA